jgi:hypothetical protein
MPSGPAPPPPGPCPKCKSERTRLLEYVSSTAQVWYFRCDDCANVWVVEKPKLPKPR